MHVDVKVMLFAFLNPTTGGIPMIVHRISVIAPALLYLLHPCSRPKFRRQTFVHAPGL
jgi:hypothetical protein